MVTNSDDWVGGWGEAPIAGDNLPPGRKPGLVLCCPACRSSTLRIRRSEQGNPIAWLECGACQHQWKEPASGFERALVAK